MNRHEHIYISRDIVNSVIDAVPAKALCGKQRTFSRDDFPAKRGKSCLDCINAFGRYNRTGQGELGPTGVTWTEFLERVYRAERAPVAYSYTFKFTSPIDGRGWAA